MSLSVNLAGIRPNIGSKVSFEMRTRELSLLPKTWRLRSALSAKGYFLPFEFEMEMTGRICAEIGSVCSNCLKPLKWNIDIAFDERLLYSQEVKFVKTEEEELGDIEERYWIYDKLEYDFEPLVVDELLKNLPIRPLCHEDCKGICEKCGYNLNLSECSCKQNEIDPRWAKLAQLQDGEV